MSVPYPLVVSRLGLLAQLALAALIPAVGAESQALNPVVELEEQVYRFEPPNNGSGPLWCHGSSCLVRTGTNLFASGLETLKDWPPLNNCRWTLFTRGGTGWQLVQADPQDRTREPSPLVAFSDGRLFLSTNPTLRTNREPGGGPAQPRVLEFDGRKPGTNWQTRLPLWENSPVFSEHSYRSFAADGPNQELILFQNVGESHAEWSFLNRQGKWSAQGKLIWPWGAEYEKPEPIRVCYPNVAVKDRAVHFCGVSDIIEPNEAWRQFKRQLTGKEWDYDFRRLFYTWTPDIQTGKFQPWIEIASRDKTCGWISPADLWVAPDGAAHLLWIERALDERLRAKFFPTEQQSHAMNYAIVKDGQVVLRRTLMEARENGEIPSFARFHITPDSRLIVFYYVQGIDSHGHGVSENRVFELYRDGTQSQPVRVALARPFTAAFTTTVRAGSPPSQVLELLGQRAGEANTMAYARVRL